MRFTNLKQTFCEAVACSTGDHKNCGAWMQTLPIKKLS